VPQVRRLDLNSLVPALANEVGVEVLYSLAQFLAGGGCDESYNEVCGSTTEPQVTAFIHKKWLHFLSSGTSLTAGQNVTQ